MKLSEYREARDAHWREKGRSSTIEVMVDRDVRAAEAAGVTWDDPGPEVLWEGPETGDAWPTRILATGAVQIDEHGLGWVPLNCPAHNELARRLLEERRQQEAVDSWTDKQAQAAEREGDAIGRTLSPEEPLPGRLAWLDFDGPIITEGDLRGPMVLDLSLSKLSPREERLLRAMIDLWNTWGPRGELRQKLADATSNVYGSRARASHWFVQLRSVLLAKPWSES